MKPTPQLNRIDHVHVYVSDRSAAEKWYKEILGFRIQKEFEFWAIDGGPLTLENQNGTVHLALFESVKRLPQQLPLVSAVSNLCNGKSILKNPRLN